MAPCPQTILGDASVGRDNRRAFRRRNTPSQLVWPPAPASFLPPAERRFQHPRQPAPVILLPAVQVEGDVLLSVLVDENGKVVDVRTLERVRQNVGINEAAVAAARRAKYQPATKDGVRVKMWTNLRLPFRL